MGSVKNKNEFKTRLTKGNLAWIVGKLRYETPLDGTCTIQVVEGKDRSLAQNRLSFVWYKFLSRETGETPQEARQYCKLWYGVPILMEVSDKFLAWWTRHSAVTTYEQQLEDMDWIDITSLFTVKQFTQYLENMERGSAKKGYVLPNLDDAYYEAMGYKKLPTTFEEEQ